MPKKNGSNRTLDILSSIGDQDFLGSEAMQNLRDHGLRVEKIAISLIRPDAAQPRRVLPEIVHQAFHHQELTPVQALRQYIEKVRIIARQKGRPFENLLDLVSGEGEDSSPDDLSQPERDLRDLTNLAVTLRTDGLVNPLTIVDCSEGATISYRIETGERRYWANYIDQEFIPGYQGDGTIACIILPPGETSVFRQAKENTSRAGLNAIGMARQAALLLLAVHDIHPPAGPVTHDFYRQALDLDLRGKREFSADILAAMGGIGRKRLSQFKQLLQLSDDALDLSDQHNIDERRLREVLRLPIDLQGEAVQQIVKHNLDARQIKRMIDEAESEPETPSRPDRNALQIAKLMQLKELPSVAAIRQVLLDQEMDLVLARRRSELLREVLVAFEREIELERS